VKETLKVINEIKDKGLIKDYAIGGAIATIFYTEPFFTYDLDIFIITTEETIKSKLIDLSPIFNYLKDKSYSWEGEYIIIEGMPVQFIQADELEKESIENAKEIEFEGIKTKIITPEYLIALFSRAGRRKDKEKIEKILEQFEKINMKKLRNILTKYNLTERFNSR